MRVRHSFYIPFYSNIQNHRFDDYFGWETRYYLGFRLCALTTP